MADSKETMKPKGYQEDKQEILLLLAVQLRLARASYSECTEAIRRSESFADSHGNIEFITLLSRKPVGLLSGLFTPDPLRGVIIGKLPNRLMPT